MKKCKHKFITLNGYLDWCKECGMLTYVTNFSVKELTIEHTEYIPKHIGGSGKMSVFIEKLNVRGKNNEHSS